jgi:tetratricopeptide (TPR) repeat protein
MQYKGTKKPIRQIAGELGVDALVEGSALREGGRVRIAVQIIDGATDAHLWADSFDREYKDILALHSQVARAIAREVKAAITPEEDACLGGKEVNPEAYEYYVRGIEYGLGIGRKQDALMASRMDEKAIELCPDFAQAHAAASTNYSALWWLYIDRTEECKAKAKAAAEKAFQLQPGLPEAHLSLAFYYYWCQLDYDQALREFETAQNAMPNNAVIPWGMGLVLRRQGKMEQSLSSLKRAFELHPLSTEFAYQVAITCAMMRDLDEANRYYDIAIRLGPDQPMLYGLKILGILSLSGDVQQARDVIESARRLGLASLGYFEAMVDLYDETAAKEAIDRMSGESWQDVETPGAYIPKSLVLAQLYATAGQPQLERSSYEIAVKQAAAKLRQRPDEPNYHAALGIAYAGLGKKDEAIREGKAGNSLESLASIYAKVGDHDKAIGLLKDLMAKPTGLGIGSLRLDPAWKPLGDHPRFQALLQKYGR